MKNANIALTNYATCFVVLLCAVSCVVCSCSQTAKEPASNEIWYTTTNGKTVEFSEKTSLLNGITSNKRHGGWCVVTFDHSLSDVPFALFKGKGAYSSDQEKVAGLEKVWLPKSIRCIKEAAFADCINLRQVIMPDSLDAILSGAFSGCDALDTVILPKHITLLGEEIGLGGKGVFEDCKGLKYVDIPNSVTSLGSNTFKGCTSLSSFELKPNMWIGEGFFENCANLTDIRLPDDTTIMDRMFYGCTSLQSIRLPLTIKHIGEDAFNGCTILNDINIPTNVHSIAGGAFDNTNISMVSGRADSELIAGMFRYYIPGFNAYIATYLMGYSVKKHQTSEPEETDFVYDELLLLMPLNNNGKAVYSQGRAFVVSSFRDANVERFTEEASIHVRKVYDYSIIGTTLFLTQGLDLDAKKRDGRLVKNPWWYDEQEDDYRNDKHTIPISYNEKEKIAVLASKLKISPTRPLSCTMYIANNGQFLFGASGGLLSKVRMRMDKTKGIPDPQKKYWLVSYYNPEDRINAELCGRLMSMANTDPTKPACYLYANYESPEDRISRAIQHEIEHPSLATQIRWAEMEKQMGEAKFYQLMYDTYILRK